MKKRYLCKIHKRRHTSHGQVLCTLMLSLNLNNMRDAEKTYQSDVRTRTPIVRSLEVLRRRVFNIPSEEDLVAVTVHPNVPVSQVRYSVEEEA